MIVQEASVPASGSKNRATTDLRFSDPSSSTTGLMNLLALLSHIHFMNNAIRTMLNDGIIRPRNPWISNASLAHKGETMFNKDLAPMAKLVKPMVNMENIPK